MGMLASGTMSSAHVEGLPDYPFPRKASKLFSLFLWKVLSRTMGDGAWAYSYGLYGWGLGHTASGTVWPL